MPRQKLGESRDDDGDVDDGQAGVVKPGRKPGSKNQQPGKGKAEEEEPDQPVLRKPAAKNPRIQRDKPAKKRPSTEPGNEEPPMKVRERRAATFARRREPSTSPSQEAWHALRNAFVTVIADCVSSPSTLEVPLHFVAATAATVNPSCPH